MDCVMISVRDLWSSKDALDFLSSRTFDIDDRVHV